jgi:hypothetical protein
MRRDRVCMLLWYLAPGDNSLDHMGVVMVVFFGADGAELELLGVAPVGERRQLAWLHS